MERRRTKIIFPPTCPQISHPMHLCDVFVNIKKKIHKICVMGAVFIEDSQEFDPRPSKINYKHFFLYMGWIRPNKQATCR